MNNKYDAKIFGDLIADFKVEEELMVIKAEINERL